jgi:hypothetical protein
MEGKFFYAVAWTARGRKLYVGKPYKSEQYVTEFAEELVQGTMKGMTHVSVQDHRNQTVWSEDVSTEPAQKRSA